MPASSSYPDTNANSLTDGIYGSLLYGPAWQGRDNAGTYTFVIDLGSDRTINEIDSDWFQVLSDYVFLPTNVTYAVSEDGNSFTQVASINEPYVSADMQAKTYRAINLDVSGRYVEVTVDGGTAWSMVDEVGVRGS